jgi:hypothetical protein
LHVVNPLDQVVDGSTSELASDLKEGWVVNVWEEVPATEGRRLVGVRPAGLSINGGEYNYLKK